MIEKLLFHLAGHCVAVFLNNLAGFHVNFCNTVEACIGSGSGAVIIGSVGSNALSEKIAVAKNIAVGGNEPCFAKRIFSAVIDSIRKKQHCADKKRGNAFE